MALPPEATKTDGATPDTGVVVKKSVLTFVGLAGVVAALTIMFYCMRAVMEIGGTCASGQSATAIVHPCPTGVGGLMTGSILLGLVFLAIYAMNAIGPNLTLFAWPALFLSLGWNFLEFGVNPPTGSGPVWGWLLCGVVFVVMGAGPLVLGIAGLKNMHETKVGARVQSMGSDAAATRNLRMYAWGLQIAAIVFGIWVGIQIYEWGTGATVTISFG
jgi:hypothetical protein